MNDLERYALNALAARARDRTRERADSEDWRDWMWPESYRRYVALLRTVKTHVGVNGSVFCRVSGPDVDVWGYVASEALDGAFGELGMDGDDWMIEDIRPGIYRLTRTAA